MVRADPLKAQDGHSLERLQRIIGRNRIEGAAPARKAEGLDTTPAPASVELDFAGEEPEAVEEDLAGGESGSPDRPDRLAEHGTTRGLEHQVKIDQFQAFISRLPMAERLRVLGLPELHAVSPPVKTPSIRSAVELSKEDQVSDALPRGNFRSAEGDNSFHAAPRNFSNLGRAEFHAPPVITRGGQAAREMQERAISPAVAQDKTAVASARLAQAFPHVHVTHFAQLSSDAQPRPSQKTLVTRSSQPVPNAMYYAPKNDDPNACLNSPHDVFTSGDFGAEISRLQNEVAVCRQRIASFPSEIQGMCAAMDRHDRRHWELHRAIEDLEESVLSCRSREAAATARVSLLRELASVGNPAGQDVAPSYSRGQDEISHKEPDTSLEPAQPDCATHALKETNKSEPTVGLHGEMDEFRRLKVMYPTASTRELAEFQVFAKAMAAHREDRRGSENRGGDNRGDTGDDQRRGRHNSRKDLKDYREHRPDGRHSAGPRWDEKSDRSHSSSDSSRRDNRRRSHRRRN